MKKIVLCCAVALFALTLTAWAAQEKQQTKEKVKTECCCKDCRCRDCTCRENCAECRDCRRSEVCRACRDCDHEGYCCDYGRHDRRHYGRRGCCRR